MQKEYDFKSVMLLLHFCDHFRLSAAERITFGIIFATGGSTAYVDRFGTAFFILIMNAIFYLTVDVRHRVGVAIACCISRVAFQFRERVAASFITFTCICPVNRDLRTAAISFTVAGTMDSATI